MKRYWFELLDDHMNDLGAFIPDGSSKQSAINKARRWMKENGVKNAMLSVNSMRTDNLLEVIDIVEEENGEDDIDSNSSEVKRFTTGYREDYAPFCHVVIDTYDNSVCHCSDSIEEAREYAGDYNRRKYRKRNPKCAG